MLQSLLIGIDGTNDDGAAVSLGIDWARRFGASVTGIGIVDELGILISEPALLAECYHQHASTPPHTGNRHRVEEALRHFVGRCEGGDIACRTIRAGGLAYQQIIEESRHHDLILLGQQTHFYDGWEDCCDETLHKVVRGSTSPVVVVPRAPGGGESVVVAFDGSTPASRALQAFEATVLDRSREVHVVSVALDRAGASRHAELAAESLRERGIDAHAHAVATLRTPAAAILDEVRRLNAGLLVMGAYGHSTMREFIVGSVTRTLLRESPIPIFCFH